MIKVTVMYPNTADGRFDFDYWAKTHFPLVGRELGEALKGAAADRGLGGPAPGSPATYVAIAHLLFDSVEAFQAAFAQHGAAIMGDLPNYTNLTPIIQISEVLL